MRYPGTSLAQHLQQGGGIPRELVAYLAAQLNLSPGSLADYATREQTMTDHARQLAAALNLRGPIRSDVPFLIEAATQAAWSTDNGMVIARGIVGACERLASYCRRSRRSSAPASPAERVPGSALPPR